MDILLIVLQSVVALLGIGVLGFWILKRGIIPENVIGFLVRLAIEIALPSVIFSNIIINFSPQELPDWWQLPIWWLLFSVTALVLTLITMFLSQKSTRSEFALSTYFQNGIFFPLIVISGLFGSESTYAVQLFIFIIFHPVVFFTAAPLFFRKKDGEEKKSPMRLSRIINPVIVATLLAVAVKLTGIDVYLPEFLITMLKILGGMTLPLIMIILGGSLYIDFRKKGKIYIWEIVKFVLVKNVLFPLAMLGILILIKPAYNVALIMFMESAVPPITGVPIVTEREGGNSSITNQFILASFVLSIVTIPGVFTLFTQFFPMP